MQVINALDNLNEVYYNDNFNFYNWQRYIDRVLPECKQTITNDMHETLFTGKFTFSKDYLPVLNNVYYNKDLVKQAVESFKEITNELENKIYQKFNRTLNVKIVLYLGLCNGAGWVVSINNETYVLLGIEKIIELNWYDKDSMRGLIFHELGHVFQNQYGILERELKNNRQYFLWQLYTEGIATYFEQILVGDYEYYHQNKNGWKNWCDDNLNKIKNDFYNDLSAMKFDNQRYFGDWVFYNKHNDVGYYLGAKFIQFICKTYNFNQILSLDVETIEKTYVDFLTAE